MNMADKMFHNAVEFSLFIEREAKQREIGVLEFLTEYVTLNSIDEEEIPPLLTEALKIKIETEARKLYSMPKKTEGEIDV